MKKRSEWLRQLESDLFLGYRWYQFWNPNSGPIGGVVCCLLLSILVWSVYFFTR